MKVIIVLIVSQLILGCMLSPRPSNAHRRPHPAMSELDDLEMLILSEQQSMTEESRALSSVERLRLGMEKTGVQRTLGQPNFVEVAGNPKYGNERWIYETSIPTLNGFYTEKKVIYFERGKIVGWESQ